MWPILAQCVPSSVSVMGRSRITSRVPRAAARERDRAVDRPRTLTGHTLPAGEEANTLLYSCTHGLSRIRFPYSRGLESSRCSTVLLNMSDVLPGPPPPSATWFVGDRTHYTGVTLSWLIGVAPPGRAACASVITVPHVRVRVRDRIRAHSCLWRAIATPVATPEKSPGADLSLSRERRASHSHPGWQL